MSEHESDSVSDDKIIMGNVGSGAAVAAGRGAVAAGRGAVARVVNFQDRSQLREWWHGVLRSHGRYACYATFLALPSNKEAIRYITDFGRELDLISGHECLIIALVKAEFKISEFDEKTWSEMVHEHITEGYSVTVAHVLDIDLIALPCLVVFQDIRSIGHVVISLQDMTADEIAKRMHFVFSTIHKAISEKTNPLTALQIYQAKDTIGKTGQTIASKVGIFAEKTFEKAMEAWIRAAIK